jgi:hypothetical protein
MLLGKKLHDYVFEITLFLTATSFFMYICHTYTFIQFMTSVLGKMVIILLIIFYTSVHKIYGVLFCLLIILFYQLDNVKWVSEGFCDTSGLYSSGSPAGGGCGCNKCGQCQQQSKKSNPEQKNYVSIVDLEDNIREKEKTDFQKRHCTLDGVLTYKDIPVKKDMSDIVFAEVKYDDENNICNLCDKNCNFRISK